VAVFDLVVHPTAHLTTIHIAEFAHGSVVGSQSVGDDCLGPAMALQGFLQKRHSRSFVPLSRHVALKNLTFVIDGAPKVMLLPVDLYEHLVEVPAPVTDSAHRLHSLASDIGPNRFHQNLTVSWQMSIPRSNSRSSTFRRLSGNRTYIITTRRITSGEELKKRNRLTGFLGRDIAQT